jgi:hypothetical protein
VKKLSLEIENLQVDSFSTTLAKHAGTGTVRGYATLNISCVPQQTGDTKSKYWSCVCTPSGQYTCAC